MIKHKFFLTLLVLSFIVSGHAVKKFDLQEWDSNYTIKGNSAFDQFGYSMTSSDINGDGMDDFVCSAPSADPLGRNSAGIVYIFFGDSETNENNWLDLSSDSADVTIYGATSGDKLGTSLVSGKIDNDEYSDLIISAPNKSSESVMQCGYVYQINGDNDLPEVIDLNTYQSDRVFIGENVNDFLGKKVLLSDINSDNIVDIIISAPEADSDQILNCGKVYIFWSNQNYASESNISEISNYTVFSGVSLNDHFGKHICCDDINNDNYNDIFIGSPNVSNNSLANNGAIYVVKGRTFFPHETILATNESYVPIVIKGNNNSSLLGQSFYSADVNNDNNADVICTDMGINLGDNHVNVIFGSNSLVGEIVLTEENSNISINNQGTNHTFATNIYSSDVNNDLIADIIIASPGSNSINGTSTGIVHVIYGSSNLNTNYDIFQNDYNEVYYGKNSHDLFGSAVILGDFNSDSKQDIWISSLDGGNNCGKVNGIISGIPWIWDTVPIAEQSDVDISQEISFKVSDDLAIDLNSIVVNVAGTTYSFDSGSLSASEISDGYLVTVVPEELYGYDQIIDISIIATDNNGYHIPTTDYRFYTRSDTDAPFTSLWNPAPDENGVSIKSNVQFNIYDLGVGVDVSSIIVNIEGENYYSGNPNFTLTGDANDYHVTVIPNEEFAFAQEVDVEITAQDLAVPANVMSPFNYHFICGEDSSEPSIFSISPANNEVVSKIHPIIILVKDLETGIDLDSAVLELDTVNILPNTNTTEVSNGYIFEYSTIDNGLLPLGEHSIHFYIEDNSSNHNPLDVHSKFIVEIDNAAPYTTNHHPEKGSGLNATNTDFSVDIIDMLSGVDLETLSIKLNNNEITGSENLQVTSIAHGYRVYYNPPEFLQGDISVVINVSDKDVPANNMPEESYSFTCIPDNSSPYVIDELPQKNAINVPVNTNISFKIMDDLTGIDKESVKLFIQNIDVTESFSLANIENGYECLYVPSNDFNFNEIVLVRILANDLAIAPNTIDINYSFTITDDVEAPTIVNMNPEANSDEVLINQPITFDIIDNGLGVDISTFEMKVNNIIIEPFIEQYPQDKFYKIRYEHENFNYSEEIKVLINVSDLADNPNHLINYNYQFLTVDDDLQKPYFTGFNPSPSSIDVPVETSISLEILDKESGIEQNSIIFKINNNIINDYVLEKVIHEEEEGFQLFYQPDKSFNYNETVNLQIYARDNSSNHNSNSMNYQFTTIVDRNAPYLVKATPGDGDEGYAFSVMSLEINDKFSGVDKNTFSMKINNVPITDFSLEENGNSIIVRHNTDAYYEGGLIVVNFSVNDKVGNLYTDSYSFTIVEDTYLPYFVSLHPQNFAEISHNDSLCIAVLDKGVGIDKESIRMKINGKEINYYEIDENKFSSNPDSLGYVINFSFNEEYYQGQELIVDLYAEDKNKPISMKNNGVMNYHITRKVKDNEVLVVPNIITLNHDNYNDRCRIIIPSNKSCSVVIYDRNGKEIKKLKSYPYDYNDVKTENYQYAIWDGKDSNSRYVNAGIYICQVKIGSKSHLNTIVIAK